MTISWSSAALQSDGVQIFVSSSGGSDSNDGLSSGAPKATLAAGKALLRAGKADQLLLKAGDTWNTGIGNLSGLGGESSSARMVISRYGTGARPIVAPTTSNGLIKTGLASVNHVLVQSIEFTGTEDAAGGISLLDAIDDFIIEDCHIHGTTAGINVQGNAGGTGTSATGVVIRGCSIHDNYGTGHGSGIYGTAAPDLVIEYCTIDHNGWQLPSFVANIFDHNIYLQESVQPIVRYNTISRASSHGIQMRGAGTAHHNLFYQNPISMLLGTGGVDGGGHDPTSTLTADVHDNVINDGGNIDSNQRGHAIVCQWLGDGGSGGTIANNIILNNVTGGSPVPLNLDDTTGAGNFNVTLSGNVWYNWGGNMRFGGDPTQLSGITFSDGAVYNSVDTGYVFQLTDATSTGEVTLDSVSFWPGTAGDEQYQVGATAYNFSNFRNLLSTTGCVETSPVFTDPTRDLDAYAATLSLADAEAFIAAAEANEKATWDDTLTGEAAAAWIQAGFSFTPGATPGAPANLGATVSHGATITGNTVAGASSYRLYRADNGGSRNLIDTQATPSFTDSDLAAGSYEYDIAAVNNNGEGTPSDPQTVVVT